MELFPNQNLTCFGPFSGLEPTDPFPPALLSGRAGLPFLPLQPRHHLLHQLKSTKQSPLQGRDLSTSRDALRGGLNQWGEVLPSAAGPSKLVINHRAVVQDRVELEQVGKEGWRPSDSQEV